jgi:hypothetical protein
MFNLLSSNTKLEKSEKDGFGYRSIGLSLAPNTMNTKGINICGKNSESCTKNCLVFSGFNSMSIKSKIKKTDLFLENRVEFMKKVIAELGYHYEVAKLDGLKLSCRLNLYSDINFMKLKVEGKTVYEWYPEIQHIEYTRHWNRKSKFKNLHYTYSADKANVTDDEIIQQCKKGLNVAMIFRKKVPTQWNGLQVFNGDISDLRHTDPKGVIIGLRHKNSIVKNMTNDKLLEGNTIIYDF